MASVNVLRQGSVELRAQVKHDKFPTWVKGNLKVYGILAHTEYTQAALLMKYTCPTNWFFIGQSSVEHACFKKKFSLAAASF